LQVFRFINLAHPSFADWANNAKTPKDEFAWLEARARAIEKPIDMGRWCVKRYSVLLFGLQKLFEMLL
jgi:hypothetical protein